MRLLDNPTYRTKWEQAGFKCVNDLYDGSYKLGLNMEPFKGLCKDKPCPCNKNHRLDPGTEAVVYYKQEVWAYHCALTEALVDSSNVLLEIIELHDKVALENHRITLAQANIKECIQDLAAIIHSNINHGEGCNATNPAAAMRGNANCTCNLKVHKELLDDVVAKSEKIR